MPPAVEFGDRGDGRAPGCTETAAARARPRVAMYSHDTMGIGHVRRNLLIANRLAASPLNCEVMLLTGALEAATFAASPGVDCLSLPGICKDSHGAYRPRQSTMPLRELVELRSRVIRAAVEAFDPDLLIVDKAPQGVGGELNSTLAYCRNRSNTRCVLGLRDVLDEPEVVRNEWESDGNEKLIRDVYDAVWVYGDPSVYDLVREYDFPPDIAKKVRFVGYLDQRERLRVELNGHPEAWHDLDLASGRMVVCMVGGGEDGAHLAEAFVGLELPPDYVGVLVSGPLMPAETQRRLRLRAANGPRMHVLGFVHEPDALVERADRVITMGGYNSVCSCLSFAKRTLVVPRIRPRREQAIRAERLRRLGLVDVLPWEETNPQRLADWLAADLPPPVANGRIDFAGLERLPQLLREVLGGESGKHAMSIERKDVCNAAG